MNNTFKNPFAAGKDKFRIYVHRPGKKFNKPGKLLEVIKRVLIMKPSKNFLPKYCRYNNKLHLVKSIHGNLSQPFRGICLKKDYLYIEVKN